MSNTYTLNLTFPKVAKKIEVAVDNKALENSNLIIEDKSAERIVLRNDDYQVFLSSGSLSISYSIKQDDAFYDRSLFDILEGLLVLLNIDEVKNLTLMTSAYLLNKNLDIGMNSLLGDYRNDIGSSLIKNVRKSSILHANRVGFSQTSDEFSGVLDVESRYLPINRRFRKETSELQEQVHYCLSKVSLEKSVPKSDLFIEFNKLYLRNLLISHFALARLRRQKTTKSSIPHKRQLIERFDYDRVNITDSIREINTFPDLDYQRLLTSYSLKLIQLIKDYPIIKQSSLREHLKAEYSYFYMNTRYSELYLFKKNENSTNGNENQAELINEKITTLYFIGNFDSTDNRVVTSHYDVSIGTTLWELDRTKINNTSYYNLLEENRLSDESKNIYNIFPQNKDELTSNLSLLRAVYITFIVLILSIIALLKVALGFDFSYLAFLVLLIISSIGIFCSYKLNQILMEE